MRSYVGEESSDGLYVQRWILCYLYGCIKYYVTRGYGSFFVFYYRSIWHTIAIGGYSRICGFSICFSYANDAYGSLTSIMDGISCKFYFDMFFF